MSELLKEIRAKYPQYNEWDDEKLVSALHQKYNQKTGSDISIDDYKFDIDYQPTYQEPIEQELPEGIDAMTGAAVPADPYPQAKPWEPSLWERFKELGSSDANKALAMTEAFAQREAEKLQIPVEDVYKKAGFTRPALNPEGRPSVQAFVEGAGIVAEQMPEVPGAVVNSVLRVIRGGDETADKNFLDEAIEFTEPSKPENVDPNYKNFYGVGKSLGFSLATLSASATAAASVPVGAPAAAFAAGGAVAYRASKDEFLDRVKEKLDTYNEKIMGRPLNQEEWSKAYEEYESAAQKYGAWEAIPEALSNLVFMRALALPFKGMGKEALIEATKRAGQVQLSEQVTETATGVGQSYAEAEAGIGEEKSIGEAFRDQMVQTALVTSIMGGGASGAKYGYETAEQKIAPGRVMGREMEQQLAQTEFVDKAGDIAKEALSPEMAQIKSTPQAEKTVAMLVKEKLFDQGVDLTVRMDTIPTQPLAQLPEPVEEIKEDVTLDKPSTTTESDQRERGDPDQSDRKPAREPTKGLDKPTEKPAPSGKTDKPLADTGIQQPDTLKEKPKWFHGTTKQFDKFNTDVVFITDDPELAKIYAKDGREEGSRVFEVEQSVHDKKIFDTSNPEHQKIFDDQFFRKYGNGAALSDKGYPDWTDAEDFKDFFEEKNLPFDAVKIQEPQGNVSLAITNTEKVSPKKEAVIPKKIKPVEKQPVKKITREQEITEQGTLFSKQSESKIESSVKKLQDKIEKQQNLTSLHLFMSKPNTLKLETIIVPKDQRKSGKGTNAVNDIVEFADKNSLMVILDPAVKDDFQGTTSRSRLVKFYKKFGFVENKGRNKDFSISASMYRDPVAREQPKVSQMKEVKPPRGEKGVTVKVQDQKVFGMEIDTSVKAKSKGSANKDSDVFYAPGHNYVGLHRSTGIPPRQDFLTIDGKRIVVPGKVQRIEPIIRTMTKIMGRRIYFGKIKGKALGFYRDAVGEIRTKKKNDVEVLAHEMAHYLDMYSNKILPNFAKLYKSDKYSDQVMALSYTDETKKLQQSEGFAEFTRLWLTNANEAKARAPDFYDVFNKTLARDKRLAKPMKKMQEQMHKFYFQGADKLGQALIGDEGNVAGKLNQWIYRRDSRIRQQMIDRFHAARKIEQELTGKISKTGESAWKQLRVSNGGYEGIADYILNYGTVNFDAKGDIVKTGRSLHDVLKPVETIKRIDEHKKDSKMDLLMRYFAGRRALELHMQERENLLPVESAKAWARLGGTYPVFESIFKEYQQFNSRMMDFYEDAGLLTKESRNTIQNMNKDYVPFNRIRETLETGKSSGGGFHKLKGGTANLNDILVNIQDGVTSNVRHALNNKAKTRLYQYISGHKDGAIFATKIAPDSKPVKVYMEEMIKKIGDVLDASGIDASEIDMDIPGLLTFWQHGVKPTVNESGNIVDTVLIEGKPRYYEVQDPMLQEMLLAMNPESYSSFMNVMFGVKNFFTRTITLGIEFTGANLVRDTIGAAFLSKHGFKPFIDSFKGMYSFLRKDKHFQAFIKSGGGYSSRIEASTSEGKARRRVAVDQYGVMSLPEKLFSVFDHYSSAFEYGTRIGEFRLAKQAGETNMDAAYAAREISTDFSVLGANRFLTGYIRTIPFLNAMVQSQDRVYREALVQRKYDGNPAGMAMKAFMGITIPTLMLYMLNRDDEDYQAIPDYEKRTNWHVKVGDRFIKIPRPYDVGFVYATMPELYFKYVEDDKGKEFADGMMWTLTQMYGVDGTPAALSGWWDLVKNEKWTGAPVVPHALSDVEATEQYNANTSETFIRLGQALGMSPIKAEHAFKAYTGYLGGYLLWGTNKILWDKDRFGEEPMADLSDNIFIRRFITKEVRPSTHAMEKFFDLKEKSDKIVATYRANIDVRRALSGKMDKKGKFKDDKFFGLSGNEKKVLFGLNDSMNKLIGMLYGKEGVKTAEIAIRYDKKLSAEEKRKQLDKLWISRNKAFMTYYNAANKALMKAKKEAEKFNQEKN